MGRRYTIGMPVIYQKTKRSSHPGPRAGKIHPSQHGEEYVYIVDKFWVVADVRDDGQLVLQTRRGKQHVVDAEDIHLRPMHWWEKLLWRNKIPDPDAPLSQDQTDAPQ